MAEPLVLVGIGGFGRETVDVIDAINAAAPKPVWDLLGVVDDAPSDVNLERLALSQVDYIGTTDVPLQWLSPVSYVVGIGSPRVRRTMAERFDAANFRAATLIHPSATRGFGVTIGDGSVICAGVRLTTNISLGRHVHINPNATVGHDTTLGDFVSMNPSSSVSGDCVIEDEVLIGVGAVVLNQLKVGSGAIVGGAACVVRDVSAEAVVKGVPAR